ncbi:MAG: N-acetylmuramoyl-L-alanine amidase [Candidatus Omnitrophica bacterium]|nr:N-acetylmuramoyl-L-alanine amidase [Candidatus Omnitrophota bacterium]
MMSKNKFVAFLCLVIAAGILSSCGTTSKAKKKQAVEPSLPKEPYQDVIMMPPEQQPADVYHTIAPGETLWRISKMYNVDLETLKRVNRIKDPTDIEIGTKILISKGVVRKDRLSLYPNACWKYIIIHHSATEEGSSALFNIAHKKRGWKGVGYDFVIDNGTKGKRDGEIEMTPRWTNQDVGAHCSAARMNEIGIGICLVGNFSKEGVSNAQMKALAYLVSELQRYYKIPSSRVLGHGQVKGATTECPGRRFPYSTLNAQLLK